MYLITDEGLKVLEETGLKKILDESFDKLESHLLYGTVYDDEIEEYAREHGSPDLLEKIKADETIDKHDSFIMHSRLISDLLKNRLPRNLDERLKDVISAYYLYCDRFLKPIGDKGKYLWRDEKFLNFIKGDMNGDMIIEQYDISVKSNLFGNKPLVKKAHLSLVNGFYPEWIRTLSDFIIFCLQIRKPVPFKDNWEEVFYNGKFEEIKPGEVAGSYIKDLKRAKEGNEPSWILILPFVDNPLRQANPKKKIYYINPIKSGKGYLSCPFIDKESLVYLHEAERGIEFLDRKWGSPGVRFSYEQIPNAIKGIVTCIQNFGSRCSPQDPGLVFKYFPYERFNDISL